MLWAGARLVTLDPERPEVEALLERDGRIVSLGSYADLRRQFPGEPLGELSGVGLPGFIDAHAHLGMLGEAAEILDLAGLTSAAEVALRVASATPIGGWVRGRAWSDHGWPEAPDGRQLPSGIPVALERVDSHALWVNQAALDSVGIGRTTPDPAGGRIQRRPDGTPTGVLVDRAMELVEQALPPTTDADLDRRLHAATMRCVEVGLVGVHDAGVDGPLLRSLLRLQADRELPIRVYAMEREADPEVETVVSGGPRIAAGPERVTLRAVKFFLDGALGSRGAAFFEPYADATGETGLLLEEHGTLVGQLTRRLRAGFQVALHAIGDRANALAIAAIAEAQRQSGRLDLRPRIEHAQHVRPSDLPAFARSGAIASMQPTHHCSDWSWARGRLGPARWKGAYAWRSMLTAGVPLAFGSDFPIEDPAPLLGLRAATARAQADDEPDERLTIDEALRAFTQGAAYAAFEEKQGGLLREGYRCDLTLLDRDPRAVPTTELASIRVLGTVVGGSSHLR